MNSLPKHVEVTRKEERVMEIEVPYGSDLYNKLWDIYAGTDPIMFEGRPHRVVAIKNETRSEGAIVATFTLCST